MRASSWRSSQLPIKLASSLIIFVATIVHGVPVHADQITEKRLDVRLGHHRGIGEAKLHMRAALGSVTEADRKLGAVLQPHFESRSSKYGRVFLTGTAAPALTRTAEKEPSILFDEAGAGGLKQVYGGWSSGRLLGRFGEDVVTLSFGREVVDQGTGTIAWEPDRKSCDAACWIQRRASQFQSTALTLKFGPGHSRVFHLRGRDGPYSSSVVGAEARLTGMPLRLGASYARGAPGSADWAGNATGYGHAEAGYDFAALLPWSTNLSFRYRFVSGDKDSGGAPEGSLVPPVLESSNGPGGVLPMIGGSTAADVRLTLRPSDHLWVDLLYSNRFCSHAAHELSVSAERRPHERLSVRVTGSVALESAIGQSFAEPALETHFTVTAALTF